jgi:hypothetical protein
MKTTIITDDAISLTTLRKFQTEIAIRDRQIAFLMEALQNTASHAQMVLAAIVETTPTDK